MVNTIIFISFWLLVCYLCAISKPFRKVVLWNLCALVVLSLCGGILWGIYEFRGNLKERAENEAKQIAAAKFRLEQEGREGGGSVNTGADHLQEELKDLSTEYIKVHGGIYTKGEEKVFYVRYDSPSGAKTYLPFSVLYRHERLNERHRRVLMDALVADEDRYLNHCKFWKGLLGEYMGRDIMWTQFEQIMKGEVAPHELNDTTLRHEIHKYNSANYSVEQVIVGHLKRLGIK